MRERGVDRLDRVVRVGRRARPRDERVHRGALVLALVQEAGVAALDAGRHRGREDQDRDGVGVGGRRGRGRVDHARTAGAQDDAGPPGDPGVAVGRVAAAGLVARRDVPDAVRRQVPVQLERVRARDAEDEFDAVLRERADDRLAAGHARRSASQREHLVADARGQPRRDAARGRTAARPRRSRSRGSRSRSARAGTPAPGRSSGRRPPASPCRARTPGRRSRRRTIRNAGASPTRARTRSPYSSGVSVSSSVQVDRVVAELRRRRARRTRRTACRACRPGRTAPGRRAPPRPRA